MARDWVADDASKMVVAVSIAALIFFMLLFLLVLAR